MAQVQNLAHPPLPQHVLDRVIPSGPREQCDPTIRPPPNSIDITAKANQQTSEAWSYVSFAIYDLILGLSSIFRLPILIIYFFYCSVVRRCWLRLCEDSELCQKEKWQQKNSLIRRPPSRPPLSWKIGVKRLAIGFVAGAMIASLIYGVKHLPLKQFRTSVAGTTLFVVLFAVIQSYSQAKPVTHIKLPSLPPIPVDYFDDVVPGCDTNTRYLKAMVRAVRDGYFDGDVPF